MCGVQCAMSENSRTTAYFGNVGESDYHIAQVSFKSKDKGSLVNLNITKSGCLRYDVNGELQPPFKELVVNEDTGVVTFVHFLGVQRRVIQLSEEARMRETPSQLTNNIKGLYSRAKPQVRQNKHTQARSASQTYHNGNISRGHPKR